MFCRSFFICTFLLTSLLAFSSLGMETNAQTATRSDAQREAAVRRAYKEYKEKLTKPQAENLNAEVERLKIRAKAGKLQAKHLDAFFNDHPELEPIGKTLKSLLWLAYFWKASAT